MNSIFNVVHGVCTYQKRKHLLARPRSRSDALSFNSHVLNCWYSQYEKEDQNQFSSQTIHCTLNLETIRSHSTTNYFILIALLLQGMQVTHHDSLGKCLHTGDLINLLLKTFRAYTPLLGIEGIHHIFNISRMNLDLYNLIFIPYQI